MVRRLIVIVIIVVGVGGGLAVALKSTSAQGTPNPPDTQIIDQTTAEVGQLRLTVSATGAVIPQRQVPLLFAGSGVVREVLVKVGDSVKAGDPLARLDTVELEAAVNDAQAALDQQRIAYEALTSPPRPEDLAAAQAGVNAAEASLNAAYSSRNPDQAQIAQLQSDLARNRLWQAQLQRDIAVNTPGFSPDVSGLIPAGANVPPAVVDQINQGLSGLIPSVSAPSADSFTAGLNQAEYGVQIADANAAAAANRGADPGSVASANAAVVSAREQLDQLKNGPNDFDLQAAEINVNSAQLAVEQAQAALDRATLVAPFDGVIAQNNLVEGEIAPADQPAMLLVDNSALLVDLAIDETDVVKVQVGQPVELSFDALPDAQITGKVTRVALVPNVVGQLVSYSVRVMLDPTDQPVRIGMSATATIITDELNNVLTLPNRFIRIDRTTQNAFVTIQEDNGHFTEIPVTLGLRNDLDSQITDGLQAGQRVILLPRSAFDLFGG